MENDVETSSRASEIYLCCRRVNIFLDLCLKGIKKLVCLSDFFAGS